MFLKGRKHELVLHSLPVVSTFITTGCKASRDANPIALFMVLQSSAMEGGLFGDILTLQLHLTYS
jgi:hypothetical protein